MALRLLIAFSLLFSVCHHHANGARDALKQRREVTKGMKEVEEAPYETSYGNKESSKEEEVSYQIQYGNQPGSEEAESTPNYITNYGTKEGKKVADESPTYITSYGTKEAESTPNYITNYGTKESKKVADETPNYITNYGTKEVETYPTSYARKEGTKEAETPNYITNYGTKEAETYPTSYARKEAETPYITSYGAKETPKYITGYISAQSAKERREIEEAYITGYISAQGAKERKEVEAPYITGYISAKSTKEQREVEEPYITGYISAQGAKERKEVEAPYITGYISAKSTKEQREVEEPYITGYISAQGPKKEAAIKCKDEKQDKHDHHHMHMHSSSPADHNEASKQGFFTINDFYKGKTMPLHFPKQDHSRFLPKDVADSIPFSTPQLPQLLQLFSIPQGSRDAKHMAYALEQCEMTPIIGETKLCATSLEAMVQFVTKIIGSGVNFNILSTQHPITSTSITQKYTILEDPREVVASKMVFCHPLAYPYAVFFCHNFEKDTKFFKVELGGENGDKVEAVAVCHMDTSDWDPNHSLFALLGIKAGASSPVCHFFPENHLVWIPAPTIAAA